ncbi:hypothetical protein EK21DRAFT_106390 [Setomelanomma holmii]|uniref:Uncharacterized protein n=1 Tax=Setomelanomma holmii TaxID=210430 RepID=A0A9P4LSD0_9PLEO|nr:hypothetical protein EK21DRAFT_106390 [Setomelanomma holmii]
MTDYKQYKQELIRLMHEGEAFGKTNLDNNVKGYYFQHRATGGAQVKGTFTWQRKNVFGEALPLEFSEVTDDSAFVAASRTFGPQVLKADVVKHDQKTWCKTYIDEVAAWEASYQSSAFRTTFWEQFEYRMEKLKEHFGTVRIVICFDLGCLDKESWARNRLTFDLAQYFSTRNSPGGKVRLILEHTVHYGAGFECYQEHFRQASDSGSAVDVGFPGPDITFDPNDRSELPDIQ